MYVSEYVVENQNAATPNTCFNLLVLPSYDLYLHDTGNEGNLLFPLHSFYFYFFPACHIQNTILFFLDLTGNCTKPKVYFYFYFYLTGFFVLLKSVIQVNKLEQPEEPSSVHHLPLTQSRVMYNQWLMRSLDYHLDPRQDA